MAISCVYMYTDTNDYENLTSPISTMGGGTTVSGSVTIIDDNMVEGEETLSFHIENCSNTIVECSVSMPYSLITINDNDGKLIITTYTS